MFFLFLSCLMEQKVKLKITVRKNVTWNHTTVLHFPKLFLYIPNGSVLKWKRLLYIVLKTHHTIHAPFWQIKVGKETNVRKPAIWFLEAYFLLLPKMLKTLIKNKRFYFITFRDNNFLYFLEMQSFLFFVFLFYFIFIFYGWL